MFETKKRDKIIDDLGDISRKIKRLQDILLYTPKKYNSSQYNIIGSQLSIVEDALEDIFNIDVIKDKDNLTKSKNLIDDFKKRSHKGLPFIKINKNNKKLTNEEVNKMLRKDAVYLSSDDLDAIIQYLKNKKEFYCKDIPNSSMFYYLQSNGLIIKFAPDNGFKNHEKFVVKISYTLMDRFYQYLQIKFPFVLDFINSVKYPTVNIFKKNDFLKRMEKQTNYKVFR